MIMKNVTKASYILYLICLVFSNCHKDENDTYKGTGHAMKNGVLWNVYAYYDTFYTKDDNIDIKMFISNERGILSENLFFDNISRNIGKNYLHRRLFNTPNPDLNTTASYITVIGGDVLGETYDIWNEDTNNYIKINQIDTIAHLLRGEFNVRLGSDSINIHVLSFTDGWFEIPYP